MLIIIDIDISIAKLGKFYLIGISGQCVLDFIRFTWIYRDSIAFSLLLQTRLAQTVAGWQAVCEDRQNF